MNQQINLLYIFTALLGFVYAPFVYGQVKNTRELLVADTIPHATIKSKMAGNIDARNDCVRGQATPIIKKAFFPKTVFTLQADSLTAIETVNFKNGDKLIITNCGCEYFTLLFRFETSRFIHDTSNILFWYQKVVLLMRELYKGLDAPINIKKGIAKLNNFMVLDKPNQYANLKLGHEVDFGDMDLRNYVTVEQIEKLAFKMFAITISFTVGPL